MATRRRSPASASVPSAQLSLFGPETLASPDERALAAEYEHARAVVSRLPARLRFGTSSWSYTGWHPFVWSRRYTEAHLAREGLVEYSKHPLFRAVGMDRGFYAPVPEKDLARFAKQLPPDFLACPKAPERVVSPLDRALQAVNPDFLSVARFTEWVLDPFRRAFSKHTGPIVLEFPPVPPAWRLAPSAFAERLDAFLAELPRELSYAVELRDRALLTPRYVSVIAKHGVAHVYNYWSAMPLPGAQSETAPVDTAGFCVFRVVQPPGTKHEERKRGFFPFERLQDVRPEMRSDVCALVEKALANDRPVFVFASNKAEGCSPRTLLALAETLAGVAPAVL